MTVLATRSRLVLALVVGVAVMLSACSATEGRGEARDYAVPELGSVAVVDSGVRLPFQQYELPPADRVRMQTGQARLLTKCMAERGHQVSVAGDYLLGDQRAGAMDPTMWGGPFGTMTLEHARRFGYKPSPDGPFVKGPGFYHSSPGHLFLETPDLSEAEGAAAEAAYYGSGDADATGPVGCAAQVEAVIDAPLTDFVDLSADLNQLAREHPQVTGAIRSWVTCMAEAGYEYSDIWGPSQRFGTAPVSQVQVDTAVADVRCTRQSHWADFYYAVLADYQRQAIDRESDLLEGALASEKARLASIEAGLSRAR